MPPIPSANLTVVDNALGAAAPNPLGAHVSFGVCSLGTPNTFLGFGNTATAAAALGTGPLAEYAAYLLQKAGGPQYFVPINPSVPGTSGPVYLAGPNAAVTSSNGVTPTTGLIWSYQPTNGAAVTSAVTQTGGGPAITLTGTPLGNYGILVQIVLGGALQTATYKFSLDGGVSWSGVLTTPAATFLMPGTGVTLNFAAGTYVLGTNYSATSVIHGPSGAGALTVTGTPIAGTPTPGLPLLSGFYDVIVKILTTGTATGCTFTYSLDGGNTYAAGSINGAATYAIPGTGLTLNFGAGTFTATDLYQFVSVVTSGAGVGSMSVTGAPLDAYQVQVKIFATGANLAAATGSFQISLDGGNSFGAIIAIPSGGTYAVPNTGMTLNFFNGINGQSAQGTGNSFVAGDIYVFATTQPGYVTADLQAAINVALGNKTVPYNWFHVIGQAATAAGAATIASAVSTLVDAAATNFQYLFGIMQSADDGDAAQIAAFANFTDFRMNVCAGFGLLQSGLYAGRVEKRPAAWVESARLAKYRPGVDPAQFDLGPLPGVNGILRDESLTPALDVARFTTLRTFPQVIGAFVTNGNMMEKTGGDFTLVQFVRVLNLACTVAYQQMLVSLSKGVRVNGANSAPLVPGAIDPRDAIRIKSAIEAQVNAAIVQPGDATSFTCTIDQTINIITTQTVSASFRIVTLGYIKTFNATIGFSNPALLQ